MIRHPLEFLPASVRKPLFLAFLAWTLILLLLFQPLNRPLMTSVAPSGIISLQLAWTADNAQEMMASWEADARLFAAFGLGFDYLFMPVYAMALALGALLAAGRRPGSFATLGAWAGWGAFLAAILDGLENLGQFHQLFNGRLELAAIIGVFATIKFSLILAGILYGLIGWLWKK